MSKEYTFDIDPQPAVRLVMSDKWKKRPSAERYFAYQKHIQYLANLNKFVHTNHMDMLFILPMPESWSKKKRASMDGQPHQQRPDWDNLAKAFQDAVTYKKDDSGIYDVRVRKEWGVKGKIVITVYDNDNQRG